MKFGSLFAGIGGFDLGFERAGMECVWQVEIDGKCNDVLARHWPDVKRYKDVRDVGRENLGAVDVVCGGFPCQDLSVAGKRGGLAGERSGLWFEFHRVIEELRPRRVVIENVPGLLSSNGGRDFAVLLRGLVKCGYGVSWRVLDAQYFGVAQRRRRVFIVGSLGNGRAAEILFERQSSPWDPAPGRETGERVAANAATSIGIDCEQNVDREMIGAIRSHQSGGSELMVGTFSPFSHYGYERADEAATIHNPRQFSGSENLIAYGVSENQRAETRLTDYSRQITSGGGKPGQGYPCVMVAPTLTAPDPNAPARLPSRDGAPAVCIRTGGDYDDPYINVDDKAFLAANPMSDRQMAVSNDYGVRRLTPTECERLQGFPDDWTAGQSDSARYRQLGNAVAVPVAEWIGRRIMEDVR